MLNFLLDHLEKEKVYKEAETNKLARQFFRNLAHQ
jgi:hypothetical protein